MLQPTGYNVTTLPPLRKITPAYCCCRLPNASRTLLSPLLSYYFNTAVRVVPEANWRHTFVSEYETRRTRYSCGSDYVMLRRVLDITHVHWTLALTPPVLCPREPRPGGDSPNTKHTLEHGVKHIQVFKDKISSAVFVSLSLRIASRRIRR